jgi:hypothetical protein
MNTTSYNDTLPAVTALSISLKVLSRTILVIGCATLGMAFCPSVARATTDILFEDYSPYGVDDTANINLNSYSVSTFSEIHLNGLGNSSNQGGTPTWAESSCDIANSGGDVAQDYSYNQGPGNANASTDIQAYDLTKNGSGHWIASYVLFGNHPEQYNVDFGTGAIGIEVSADNNGDEGGGFAYADVEY